MAWVELVEGLEELFLVVEGLEEVFLVVKGEDPMLGIEVAQIPTKLRIYTYDTPTHFRVDQPL